MNAVNATHINDFGPRLNGRFDFTLLFEQSVLSILPSTLFLVVSPLRIAWLFREEIHARSGGLLKAKFLAATVLFCLQLALVVLWTLPSTLRNRVSLAAAILALMDSCIIFPLVYAEHRRSIKPSILLSAYLALSTLLDLAQGRSLFLQLQLGTISIASLFAATFATKLTLLILEELPKRTLLVARFKDSALESTSGPMNRSIFWWINQLFFKGFRSLLEVGDLGSIGNKFTSNLLLSKLSHFWDKANKSANHSLLTSTLSAFKVAFIAPILPRLCLAGFTFAQPFLVNRVIDFVGQTSNDDSSGIAGGLIGATALVYTGIAISRCLYNHLIYQLITILRGGLASLIFKRCMELDVAAANNGVAVTLMSTDIEGIADGIKELHEIWANIFELGVAVYLLSRYIGSACFVTVIPAVVCSIVTFYSTDGMGPARGEWNSGVEKRVSTTSSMLAQIKGLKMMGLTDYIAQLIQGLRVSELDCSKKFRMFIVRIILITNFSDQMTPAVVVLAAVLWTRAASGGFTVSEAFTSLSIVALVAAPISNLVGSYPTFKSSLACFDRIQQFLTSDEHKDERICDISHSSQRKSSSSGLASTSGISAQPEYTISNIEMQGLSPKGLAGSKANIFVEFENASFSIRSKTEPVLHDISLSLEKSSLTMIVGPVGSGKSSILKAVLGEIPISCGNVRVQQVRESIAYCDQSPWIRNLSIRENIVGESEFVPEWFTSVIHACSLQQDISSFPKGDKTLAGSGGISLSGGQKQRVALARAVYSRNAIVLLDDIFSALDPATSVSVFDRLLGPNGLLRQIGATIILATHAVSHLPSADHIIVLNKTGGIEQSGSFSQLQASDGYIKELALQARLSPAAEDKHQEPSELLTTESEIARTSAEEAESWKRQIGDISLHKFYLKSVGTSLAVIFIFLAIAYIFTSRVPQIWLRIWTERGTNIDRRVYCGAYISFCLGAVLFSGLVVWWFFVVIIPKSATYLHWLLLDAVIKAPLWFFTTTDSGITLNRFSQDMTLFDQKLPIAFFETTLDSLDVIAGTALIASGAQYVGAVIPLCFVPIYFLQKIYLRTSRQIRHLDLETKSPLYRHFTETLSGVITIRAFGWKSRFLEENHRLLDSSQKPYYLLFCIQRWLAVVMDLFVAGIAIVLVAFAVEFTHTTSRGAIGLAMINIIGFNNSLSRLVTSWTNLETSLGAAARLRDFLRDTPKEDYQEDLPAPPKDWPLMGGIQLDAVTATYHLSSETVLRDVSLSIKPGQKVGICGRTGSGKSSLLLTILRLLETPSGSLYIDGLDLCSIPVNKIGSHLTTLPQDPVKLPGTIRDNLDPVRSINSDDDLISALTKVNMLDAIITGGGLDAEFNTLNLSHGQQQLFCLARALLHKRKVVLLDEATSSVDRQTDEEIQKVIRSEFADCTVLAVAHRLDTIGNSDVVVVVDQGKVVEVGDPLKLREETGSLFKALWESRHG